MRKLALYSLAIIGVLFGFAFAQEIDAEDGGYVAGSGTNSGVSDEREVVAVSGIIYNDGSTDFVSSDVRFVINATDEGSGVKTIYYMMDNSAAVQYADPIAVDLEGKHTIGYRVEDNVGNISSLRNYTFVMDATPPVATLRTPQGELIVDSKVYFTAKNQIQMSATDNLSGVAKIFFAIDGAAESAYSNAFIPALADGSHKVVYYAVDNVGNVSEKKTYDFLLDTTAPVATVEYPADVYVTSNAIYLGRNHNITIDASDNLSGVASVQFAVDSGESVFYEKAFIPGVDDGKHTVTFFAKDKVGNTSEVSTFEFVKDTTAPVVTLKTVQEVVVFNGGNYVTGAHMFTLTASDALCGVRSIEYAVDNGAMQNYVSNFTAEVADGWHTISYRATDNLGNVSETQTYKFFKDDAAPTIAIVLTPQAFVRSDINFISERTKVTFEAKDNETAVKTILYSLDGADYVAYTAAFQLKAGSHTIKAKSVDLLGNVSEEIEIVLDVDAVAPESDIIPTR